MVCDREDQGQELLPGFEAPDTAMSTLGYTDVVGRLDLLADRLASIESSVVWTANPKEQRPRVEPMPRPETALDRERERRTRSLLEDIDAMLRGDGLLMTFE